MRRVVSAILGIAALALAGGCASVSLPDVDFFKLPEHKEAQKDAAYPKVGDAPKAPTDTRTDVLWDQSAARLIRQRDNFSAPESGKPERSPEELNREFELLKAQVNEYKKDDPK